MKAQEIKRLDAKIRVLNAQIAWTNVQLFWYMGYGPVALAACVAALAAKVL